MPIPLLLTRKAIPSLWLRRAREHSHGAARSFLRPRRQSTGCRGSSASLKPLTSGAFSCRAPIATTSRPSNSSDFFGRRESLRARATIAMPVMGKCTSITRRRCYPRANGSRRRNPATPRPSGFICRRFIPPSVGSAGSISRVPGKPHNPMMKPSAASRTACLAKRGWKLAKRQTGKGSTTDASNGRQAQSPAAGYF